MALNSDLGLDPYGDLVSVTQIGLGRSLLDSLVFNVQIYKVQGG